MGDRTALESALFAVLDPVEKDIQRIYDALGSQLDSTRSRYMLLCDTRACVERWVNRVLLPMSRNINQGCYTTRLPDEVWSDIFARLPPTERFSIPHVCSRWSAMARGMPSTWTTLEFLPRDNPFLVETLVPRSFPHGLSLTFNFSDGRYLPLLNQWAPVIDSPWVRMRRLYVLRRGCSPTAADAVPELIIPKAPMLEDLCIEGPVILAVDKDSATALKRARLTQVAVACHPSFSAWPFSNIESLIWRPCPTSSFYEEIQFLMRGCVALRSLILYGLGTRQSPVQDPSWDDMSSHPLQQLTLMGSEHFFSLGAVYDFFAFVPHIIWYDDDFDPEVPPGFIDQVGRARKILVRSSLRAGIEVRNSGDHKLYDLQVLDLLRRELLRIPEVDTVLYRSLIRNHLVDLELPLEVWYGIGALGRLPFLQLHRLVLHEIDAIMGTTCASPTCPALREIVLHVRTDPGQSVDLIPFIASLATGCVFPLESVVLSVWDRTALGAMLEEPRPTLGMERWANVVTVSDDYCQSVLDGGASFYDGEMWQDTL
ncbi:hypothetical protein AURDEDRAFT_131809 [Auricularia subglabra TFB-10046 SS5]|uniref:F-box domain-containing protein n=1 Tax=Auricularia subglabra (strain TFB-10046 / SS5) TaxID=717982 RepID=J0WMZ6_AURST|nr:hypothetical protein AURDEDRAFT_131809 [Auricularia subglabra TFB-10046 SS5]